MLGSWVASPFGFVDYHSILYKKLLDSGEGFLAEDQVVVTVDIKDIGVAADYTRLTLGNDMRFINVEVFGKSAITSRLKQGSVFGIAPMFMIRSFVITANYLVRQYAAIVSISHFFIWDLHIFR